MLREKRAAPEDPGGVIRQRATDELSRPENEGGGRRARGIVFVPAAVTDGRHNTETSGWPPFTVLLTPRRARRRVRARFEKDHLIAFVPRRQTCFRVVCYFLSSAFGLEAPAVTRSVPLSSFPAT